jgi:hypothetical protein
MSRWWLAAALVALPAGRALEAPAQPAWRLVEDVRIGHEDRPDYVLEAVRPIVAGPEGRIYAAEPRAGEVLVYDSTGAFVRRFGRRGSGPGEFQAITGMGWLGGSLWVADRVQARVTFFSPDGELRSTRPLPDVVRPQDRLPRVRTEGLLADGSVLTIAEPAVYGGREDLVQRIPLLRHRPSGAVDTLLLLNRSATRMRVRAGGAVRDAPMPVPRSHDRWAVAPDGSFVVVIRAVERRGVIAGYEVEAVDAAGRLRFQRRFQHEPIPLSREDRDRAHRAFAEYLMREAGLSRGAATRQAERVLPVPRTYLAADWVFIGTDARIWISRRDARDSFFVLDGRTGAEIARVRLPPGTPPGTGADAADAGSVWLVEYDEMRVANLVRYRIEADAREE